MTEILHRVGIDLGDRSYPILIGSGLLSNSAIFAQCPKATQAVMVTNTTVAPLYAAQLQAALAAHYPQVRQVVLPDGEAFKDWATLKNQMTSQGTLDFELN